MNPTPPTAAIACDASQNISGLNFAISNSSPWIQGYDLDMRFDYGFNDAIPGGTPYTPYASVFDTFSNTPGVIFSGDSSYSFGSGQASITRSVVGGTTYPEVFNFPSGNPLHTSYGYLSGNAASAGITPRDMAGNDTSGNSVCSGGGIGNCTIHPNLLKGVYGANGNVKINTSSLKAASNYIFLINGTLTINGNITIPTTSTALFTSSSNIIIDKSVGAASNSFPRPTGQLQGFYSADNSFTIQGNNNCSLGIDKMLNIEGSVVVNANGTGGSVVNQRNLCGDNATIPSLTIAPRLDFILNAPSFLMVPDVISNEVAP